MSRLNFRRFVIPVAAGFMAACSEQSPVGPDPSADGVAVVGKALTVPGTYELSFRETIEGLVLIARVEYAASGLPAQGGEVKYYACRSGVAPAPSAECAAGRAHWSYEGSAPIVQAGPEAGNALRLFGSYPAGTIIGFFFRYSGQRTGIADGASVPVDYTAPAAL